MAIQFARCEYISRSTGGNACRKASYNQRDVVACERTGEVFSFKERDGNVHHEVLLPIGADGRFSNSSVLWNEAENCEKRKDSQVAKEFVIALPDDAQVTVEDRIELTRRFGNIFVEKGVAVQLDVHSPHDSEKNWHAHLLVTTRRFSEDGLTFYSKKATDLDPVIRGKSVVEANLWGEIWRDLQNDYFEEKGYDLRVDPIGIVPQEHLGPVRMRHHLNEAVLRAELLQKANEKIAQNPQAVLEEITRNRSVFTQKDVELFLRKHVPENERNGLLEHVLNHNSVFPLYDKVTCQQTKFFTTKEVRAEEEKLLRFVDAISNRPSYALPSRAVLKGLENRTLSDEQKAAYDLCTTSDQNLCVIQGRAGVGKSYVLNAIREAHEASGFRVLGLAPTNKVTIDLKNDGFKHAKTCHSFLFRFKNGREKLDSKTLVIVDEAGMLGTTLSVELSNVVKNSGAKLIFVGDERQFSSVERGGAFGFLAERYGAVELRNVRRQTVDWQKAVSESLAEGDIKNTVSLLQENKAIAWNPTKEESLSQLLKDWAKDSLLHPTQTRQIITQKNVDVDALNQGARDFLRAQGRLGETEILCTTERGRVAFAEGDRVQFTTTDKEQGLMNGSFGIIERIDQKTKLLTVLLDNKETKILNPNTYDGLRHGYAATVYKTQGATISQVYVLHSPTTTQSTNYVALSRQTKSLGLYVNQEEAPSPASLIHQMGRADSNETSLRFDTQKDIEKRQEEKTLVAQLKHGAETILTKITDVFHKNEKFYQFEKPANVNSEKAELVGYKSPDESRGGGVLQQEGEIGTLQKVQDQGSLKARASENNTRPYPQGFDAKVVEDALRQNISSFADDVFSSIGEPFNSAASSSIERRYGKNGHIAVNLKTGAWIDYKDDSLSGGPLHMLTKLKGFSFKEALEYGANWAGLAERELSQRATSPKDPEPKEIQSLADKPVESAASSQKNEKEAIDTERQAKIAKAQALWDKGKSIDGTLAERYLREHRKIEGDLPKDLRYLSFFTDSHSKRSFPCLMAGARSRNGNVTAVQITFLNAHTAAKADIPVAKRSFGMVKGSSVTLQGSLSEGSLPEHSIHHHLPNKNALSESKTPDVLFVAEGIETALSLKSADIQGTIKASLGLSNIKRILPESPQTQIVICADHDAPDSPAAKSLEKSVSALQEKGYFVSVIKPDKLGDDFNDVLKSQGPQGVKDILTRDLPKDLVKIVESEMSVALENPDLVRDVFEKKPIEQSSITLPQKFEEKLLTLSRDSLGNISSHQNSGQKDLPPQERPTENPIKKDGLAVFDALTQQCVKTLYVYLGEKKIDLTTELIKRIEKQADKAANFIFHAHTLKGTRPTEKETKHFLLRAKYELDRIPEIRDDLITGWKKLNSFKGEKDELIANMLAERQASIEGRLYWQAKQRGLAIPSKIADLAKDEIKRNKAVISTLVQELTTKQRLSQNAAHFCAKDITRYVETHGQKPTAEQIFAMAQIAREVDKKAYPPSMGTHNIEYLQRRESELQFREWAASHKDLSGFKEFPHAVQDHSLVQSLVKSVSQEKALQRQRDTAKSYEMDFSM